MIEHLPANAPNEAFYTRIGMHSQQHLIDLIHHKRSLSPTLIIRSTASPLNWSKFVRTGAKNAPTSSMPRNSSRRYPLAGLVYERFACDSLPRAGHGTETPPRASGISRIALYHHCHGGL